MPFGNLKAMQPHGNLFSAAAINFYSSEEWLNETAQKVPSCVREQVSLSQRPTNKRHPKKQPPASHPNLPAMIIACITALPPRTVSPTSLYSSWACAGYTRSTCSTCRCFVLSKHRPHHYVEVTQAGSHRSCVSVVPLQKHHQQESSQGQLSAHRPCHRPKKRLDRATGRLADLTSNIPPSRAPSATPTPKEPRRRSLRIKKKSFK